MTMYLSLLTMHYSVPGASPLTGPHEWSISRPLVARLTAVVMLIGEAGELIVVATKIRRSAMRSCMLKMRWM